jgi:hypothetical protein
VPDLLVGEAVDEGEKAYWPGPGVPAELAIGVLGGGEGRNLISLRYHFAIIVRSHAHYNSYVLKSHRYHKHYGQYHHHNHHPNHTIITIIFMIIAYIITSGHCSKEIKRNVHFFNHKSLVKCFKSKGVPLRVGLEIEHGGVFLAGAREVGVKAVLGECHNSHKIMSEWC